MARKHLFFVLFLISLMLASILPQPASADLPPGGKWGIQAEGTIHEGYSSPTYIKLKLIFQGEFNDANGKPGTGNVTGTVRIQAALGGCTPSMDVTFQVEGDLIVWPSSTNSKRHLKFIEKNPKVYHHTFTCFHEDGTSFTIDAQYPMFIYCLNAYLDYYPDDWFDGEVPLKEGTFVLDRTSMYQVWINNYTFKPLFCTEIVQIPLVVALINNPVKPDGTPVDRSYVNQFEEVMNEIYKQSCVQFKLELIT